MATDKKPTEEQVNALQDQFKNTFFFANCKIQYHNNRMHFFKKWNLSLKIIDAAIGVGGLVYICFCPGKANSFWVAGVAVFLLFLNVLLDLSKKEEIHRWLISSYISNNKLTIINNTANWKNLCEKKYKKYKKILFEIEERTSSIKKEESPVLNFLDFLSEVKRKENTTPVLSHVKWYQFILANYFSMPNSLVLLKYKTKEEEEKKKQQQETSEPKTP